MYIAIINFYTYMVNLYNCMFGYDQSPLSVRTDNVELAHRRLIEEFNEIYMSGESPLPGPDDEARKKIMAIAFIVVIVCVQVCMAAYSI
jgi:hypothetical protein